MVISSSSTRRPSDELHTVDSKEQAVELYLEAYKKYSASNIANEEAMIVLKQRGREALNAGVTLQTLDRARKQIDNHAEFMTDWD